MLFLRAGRSPRNHAPFLAVCAFGVLTPAAAHAHFILDAPMSSMSQNVLGSPQKQSPCGDEGGGTPSGVVTAFQAGETITLKWREVIAHDGWYRIALSYNDRADLMDPPYELNSAGNSVDAGIEDPPVAPVLVDGLYPHTLAGTTTPKSYQYDLTLPTTPCAKCTLQVIQIMLNHPNNQPYGYTYHHCADISIQGAEDAGTVPTEGGSAGMTETAVAPSHHTGCAVGVDGRPAPVAGWSTGFAALAVISRRLRRRYVA